MQSLGQTKIEPKGWSGWFCFWGTKPVLIGLLLKAVFAVVLALLNSCLVTDPCTGRVLGRWPRCSLLKGAESLLE